MEQIVIPELESYSHSMIESYLSCRKKFQYAHVDNLERKRDLQKREAASFGASLGTDGHAFLEEFFRNIKKGHTDQEALELAMREHMITDRAIPAMERAMVWIKKEWPKLNWEVLEVEVKFKLPVGNGLYFTGRVDLIVKDKSDGKVYVVDHKFLSNLYDPEVIGILSQLPKYIGALRALGMKVDGAYYNLLRSRKTEKDPYRLEQLTISDERVKEALATQVLITREIAGGFLPVRNTNSMGCKYCPFKVLCGMEVQGMPTKITRELEFQENSYNYNAESKEEEKEEINAN